jgi:hypothetical protein
MSEIKSYYEQHKDVILCRLAQKVECNKCARTVRYSHLRSHQNSDICKKIYANLQCPVIEEKPKVTIEMFECPMCKRIIQKDNYEKHKKTKICMKMSTIKFVKII